METWELGLLFEGMFGRPCTKCACVEKIVGCTCACHEIHCDCHGYPHWACEKLTPKDG